MNTSQLLALCIAIVLLILIGLFPPWKQTFQADGIASERPMGHALLLTPPEPEQDTLYFGVQIDVTRLAVLWLIVAGAAVGVIVALGCLPERRPTSPSNAASSTDSPIGRVPPPTGTWSWRTAARIAYAWNQALLLLLFLGSIALPKELIQWYHAVTTPDLDATWLGINVGARGASLVYLFVARMKTTTAPHQAGWMLLLYAIVMTALGLVGVAVSSGRETATDESVYILSNIQVAIAIVAGVLAYPLITERGQSFSSLLAYLEHHGVPTPWLAGDAGDTFILDPTEPHEKVKPIRILQAIALGKMVVPANVRVNARPTTPATDKAVSP